MKKHLFAAAAAVVSMASLHAQTTIVNYSTGATNVAGYTGYFSTANGWSGSTNFWEGQQGWTGSGSGADSVEVVAGITPGGANDNSGTLGLYPTTTPIATLDRSFTPMNTLTYTNIAVSFAAEFSIAEIVAPNGNNDAFVFDLNSSGTSGLAFTMQAPAVNPFDYTLRSVDSGGLTAEYALDYNSVYRLQIDLVGNAWTGTLYGVTDPSGARTIAAIGALSGGLLANGLSATDLNNLEVAWILDSGDANDPGSIALIANEFTIQSTGDPIPEPGTWAVGALLVSGAAAAAYRRRKMRSEKAAA